MQACGASMAIRVAAGTTTAARARAVRKPATPRSLTPWRASPAPTHAAAFGSPPPARAPPRRTSIGGAAGPKGATEPGAEGTVGAEGGAEPRTLAGGEWGRVFGLLFAAGAVTGPLLDGIHSAVGLQTYDLAPLTIGPLLTSAVVPPLLGAFYAVVGCLHLAIEERTGAPRPPPATGRLALCVGALALQLELSADLYDRGAPYPMIAFPLAVCAAANFVEFEGRGWAAALAALVAVSAPAAELVLMALFGVWHYPRADVILGDLGFVSWVPLCYFFYVPTLAMLSSWLRARVVGGQESA